MPHENSESVPSVEKNNTSSSAGAICRKALRFIFSTAGLFLINFGYLLLGASIFTHLEKYNEEQTCFSGAEEYRRAENATLVLMTDIFDRAMDESTLQEQGGNAIIRSDYSLVLKRFSMSVLDVGHDISKNCSMLGQPGGPQYAWSFSGSLVFAMTVTTTIGYGVIAPKTTWGRLVCIAYAIIGLPIMLICLANIGDVMADIFRFAYATVCCCGCCRSKPKRDRDSTELTPVTTWRTDSSGRPVQSFDSYDDDDDDDEDDEEEEEAGITVPLTISMLVLFSFVFLGAALFFVWEENLGFLDAVYFCFVTFSTIGFGDIVPGTTDLDSAQSQAQLIVTGLYQILGMAMVSMCFQLMQDEIVAKVRWLFQKCGCSKKNEDKAEEQEEIKEIVTREDIRKSARPRTAIRSSRN